MLNEQKTTLWVFGVIALTVLVIIGVSRIKNNDNNVVTINTTTGADTEQSKQVTQTSTVTENVPVDTSVKNTTSQTTTNQPTKKTMEKTITSPDGLKITILQEGTGTAVSKTGDSIVVAYKGMLVDGTVFDQGTLPPMTVGAPGLITGFDRGMTGMKVGETRSVFIPSALGYGAHGAGALIKPNSDLVFEITLKEIK